jgi:hypothetical protein
MTGPSAGSHRLSPRERLVAIALALLVVAVFAGANAHLIVVSVASQPDCVADEGGAALRAAKPSC